MAIDIVAWVYTTDQVREYQLGVARYIAAQGGATPLIGGRQQVTGDNLDRLPASTKPRSAKVSNAANGKNRTVVCFSQDAPLYTGTAPSVSLMDGAGVAATYLWNGTTGERSRRRSVEAAI